MAIYQVFCEFVGFVVTSRPVAHNPLTWGFTNRMDGGVVPSRRTRSAGMCQVSGNETAGANWSDGNRTDGCAPGRAPLRRPLVVNPLLESTGGRQSPVLSW